MYTHLTTLYLFIFIRMNTTIQNYIFILMDMSALQTGFAHSLRPKGFESTTYTLRHLRFE